MTYFGDGDFIQVLTFNISDKVYKASFPFAKPVSTSGSSERL